MLKTPEIVSLEDNIEDEYIEAFILNHTYLVDEWL